MPQQLRETIAVWNEPLSKTQYLDPSFRN